MVVAIASVVMLGDNMNWVMLGIKKEMQTKTATAASFKNPNAALLSGGGFGNSGQIPLPKKGSEQQICFKSGMCINVPIVEGGEITNSVGANGGDLTLAYAKVLKQLAAELEAAGADPALINKIKALAEQADLLGNAEKDLAALCPPGEPCAKDNATNDKIKNKNAEVQAQMDAIRANQSQFDSLYGEVSNLLANDATGKVPPEAANLIHMESKEILALANGIQSGSGDDGDFIENSSSINPGADDNKVVVDIDPDEAGEITKQDADEVCTVATGGDVDGAGNCK